MSDDLVEKIRYEADITDIQSKLTTLATKHDKIAGDTEKSTGRMSKAWAGVKGAVVAAPMWFAAIGAGAAIAIPKILDQGASLQALDQKAKTVFSGSSLASVQAWARNVAGSMGVTTSQAIDMAASMGVLFKPMGFTADQAAAMATQLGDLSGALSAWSGGKRSAAEVSEVITKAMLGERDGLKELGISISEADVQARLAANGQDKLTGSALEQAKALVTQQLIMEKSQDAQRAWADGSMDATKQQNESRAAMRQLGETMTRLVYPALAKLVPILTDIAVWLGQKLPSAFQTVKGFFDSVIGGGKRLIEDLANVFGISSKTILMVIGGIGAALVGLAVAWNAGPGLIVTAIAALVAGFLWAYENVEWFRKGVQIAFAAVGLYIRTMIAIWKTVITTVIDVSLWVGRKVGEIVGFVTGIPGRISATISNLWTGLRNGISAARDWVASKISEIVSTVVGLPGRILSSIGQWASAGLQLGKKFLGGLKDGLSAMSGFAGDIVSAIVGGLKDAWNSVAKFINDKIPNKIGKWPLEINLPDNPLPTFHTGGITNFGPAGQGLALLRNNEAVIPLDSPTDASRVARQAGLAGTVIQGDVHIHSTDTPRRWYDESMWRVS